MAQTTPKIAFCQPYGHKSFFILLLHTRRSCLSIVREKDQTHCCVIIQTLLSVINNKRKPSLRENSPTCLPATTSLRPPLGAFGTACRCWLAIGRVGPVAWLLACPLLRLLMYSCVILGTAGKQQHTSSGRWDSFQCPQGHFVHWLSANNMLPSQIKSSVLSGHLSFPQACIPSF